MENLNAKFNDKILLSLKLYHFSESNIFKQLFFTESIQPVDQTDKSHSNLCEKWPFLIGNFKKLLFLIIFARFWSINLGNDCFWSFFRRLSFLIACLAKYRFERFCQF